MLCIRSSTSVGPIVRGNVEDFVKAYCGPHSPCWGLNLPPTKGVELRFHLGIHFCSRARFLVVSSVMRSFLVCVLRYNQAHRFQMCPKWRRPFTGKRCERGPTLGK